PFRSACPATRNWSGCWQSAKTCRPRRPASRYPSCRRSSGLQKPDKSCCATGSSAVFLNLSPGHRGACLAKWGLSDTTKPRNRSSCCAPRRSAENYGKLWSLHVRQRVLIVTQAPAEHLNLKPFVHEKVRSSG